VSTGSWLGAFRAEKRYSTAEKTGRDSGGISCKLSKMASTKAQRLQKAVHESSRGLLAMLDLDNFGEAYRERSVDVESVPFGTLTQGIAAGASEASGEQDWQRPPMATESLFLRSRVMGAASKAETSLGGPSPGQGLSLQVGGSKAIPDGPLGKKPTLTSTVDPIVATMKPGFQIWMDHKEARSV